MYIKKNYQKIRVGCSKSHKPPLVSCVPVFEFPLVFLKGLFGMRNQIHGKAIPFCFHGNWKLRFLLSCLVTMRK